MALTSADFNLDGKADLAVANRGENTVSLLLGFGTGIFLLATVVDVGNTPQQIASADLNGDSKADLAVGNVNSSNVSVLIGVGDGTFEPPVNYAVGSPVNSIAISDFNNDAHLDLAAGSNSGGVATQWMSSTKRSLSIYTKRPTL